MLMTFTLMRFIYENAKGLPKCTESRRLRTTVGDEKRRRFRAMEKDQKANEKAR